MPAPPAAPKALEVPVSSDDLTRIRAVDAETEKRLNQLGVYHFADIANWSPADVNRISRALGYYGRIEQENWIEQAQILAKGTETHFSRRKTEAEPGAPLPPAPGVAPDRLLRIIGLDSETEKKLIGNGITRFAQIASWSPTEVERIEGVLGSRGRIARENWIEQARVLSRGSGGEGPRPVRLADAIRENAKQPTAIPAQAVRSDLAGLRSVRSEALRGETVGAAPRATGRFDDLKRIRGIGVMIDKKLASLGVTTYEQVANWTAADIARISQILDFKGRIERENWVEQARILGCGGQTEFSRRVDRGEVETSRDQRS
jgi:predicted flap endonuclease-1-like 5' DNA nuclease